MHMENCMRDWGEDVVCVPAAHRFHP
jgi:hypothetical protein